MRTAAVVAVVAGALLAATACTKSKPSPGPTEPPGRAGVAVAITPSKPEYARGEQVVLSVTLTNGVGRQCRISRVPDGGLTLVSFTRGGTPVAPALVRGGYGDGFANFLTVNLVPLAPGASLAVPWTSEGGSSPQDRAALRTSTMDTLDEAMLTFWPIGEPGRYELSARYVPPALPTGPADACPASGDPAQAAFTVGG